MTSSITVPPSGQARINWKRQQRAAFWSPVLVRTIWTGDGTTDHEERSRVIAWLRANRIDPTHVDAHSPILATRDRITFTAISRNEHGRPFMDDRGRLDVQMRHVPLRILFFTPPTEA